MAKQITPYGKRQQQIADRKECRKTGICIDCREQEAGWNLNGERSLRCSTCKERYLANRSASMPPSKTSIAAPAPSRIRRSSDEIDERHEAMRDIAAKRILPFIESHGEAGLYHAAITREFPDVLEIDSVLKTLKVDGFIDFNEYAPAPVRVKAAAMNRVNPNRKAYGKCAVAPRGDQSRPYPDSLFGEEHVSAI